MAEPALVYRVEGGVAWMVINREERRNSLSAKVVRAFLDHMDRAEADKGVRAVCITGAGEKAFCSWVDLGGAAGGEDMVRDFAALIKRLAGYPKPTVARVNGACLAGGMGLMLACDLVVAAEHAVFGTPEVKVGLFPMIIGALMLRDLPRKKAMEMALLGGRFTAQEALEMGFVNRVVPLDALDGEVGEVLETLVRMSPIGLRLGKEAFQAAAGMPFEQAVDFLSRKLVEVASTEDALEGITAFLQKRDPTFKGK